MNLLSNANLNLISGGNAEMIAFEMCVNVTNTFTEAFIAAAPEQQTAIFNYFLPKIQEVCTVAVVANAAKFAEFFLKA